MTLPFAQPPVTLVLAARPFASDLVRIEVPAGATIADMVLSHAGPLREGMDLCVWLGDMDVPAEVWHRVRPKPGTTLHAKVVPQGGGGGGGKNALRIVASIAIIAASVATGQLYGAQVGASLGVSTAVGTAITSASVGLAASLAYNALVPPPKPQVGQMEQRYSVTATNNATPYGPVPILLGRHRWAPRFAAKPYTELQGQDQYVRILYDLGPGPISIDMATARLGDTPLSDYSDVEVETREGWDSDAPIRLFPGQVEELAAGAGLPAGELRQADGWVTRTIGQQADELSADFVYPGGIWRRTGSGNRRPHTAGVELQYAAVGSDSWQSFPGGMSIGEVSGAQYVTTEYEGELRYSYRVAVPRGTYQVRARRLVDNTGNSSFSDAVVWTAARAVLNEAPVSTRVPHAYVALRIRASGQLSGPVSNLSVVCTRIVPGVGPTRNPADLFRWFCTSDVSVKPADPSKLDQPTLDAWRDACVAQGRTYDAVIEGGTRYEVLKQIAAAGRAQFQIRDARYSVVRDVIQAAPVTVITPRVSRGFKMLRAFPERPHGLKVRFYDADADYELVERIVYDDGYDETNATLFEGIDLPGVTDPDLVYKDGRYHLAAMRLRPAVYELEQDFEHLMVRRGDRVDVQHDVLLVGLASARVKSIAADRLSVEVDDLCPMVSGKSYAIRARTQDGADVVAAVETVAGEQTTLTFASALSASVEAGDLIAFGEAGKVTLACIVKDIRPGPDLSARLTLLDYAPAIAEAETGPIPPYDPGITTARLPAVTGLTLAEVTTWQAGARVPTLVINWRPVTDQRAVRYALMVRDPSGRWESATPSRGAGHDIPGAALGLWQVRVWAESEDGRRGPVAEAAIQIDGVGDVADITGFTAVASTAVLADGSVQPSIRVSWDAATAADLSYTAIRWRPVLVPAAPWQTVTAPWGAGETYLMPVVQPQTYEVQAARELPTGVRSDWTAPALVNVGAGIEGARVVGLELFGRGLFTEWEGRDVRIVWRGAFPDTVPEIGSEAFGAGTGNANPYFRGYVVRVFDPATGAMLREEPPQTAAEYVYRYDDNVTDGGPRRALRFVVSIAPKIGPEVGAASLEVTNPRPGAIQGLTVEPVFNGFRYRFQRPSDLDWRGVLVHRSTVSDFTPSAGNLWYDGQEVTRELLSQPGVPVYLRFALYDDFGRDGLVYSDEVTVTPEGLNVEQLTQDIVGVDILTPDLRERIELIDGPASLPGSVAARIAEEAGERVALETSLNQLSATVTNPTTGLTARALATTVNQALATESQARADSINQVSARLDNVGGSGATIEQRFTAQASSIGALNATYTLRVQSVLPDGTLVSSGFGLSAGTGGPARVAFTTDAFTVSLNGTPTPIFTVGPHPVTGQPAVVINGAAYAGTINANQVITPFLSAFSANLGIVTAGRVQNSNNTTFLDLNSGAFQLTNPATGQVLLSANGLGDGVVTARNLVIGTNGAALNVDPGFLDPTAWQTDNGPPPFFTDIADGAAGTRVVQGQDTWVSGRQLIPIDPSKTYRIRCRQRGVVSNGSFYLVVRAVDASGNNIAGDGTFWAYPVIAGWNDGVWRTATGFVGAGTSRPFPSNARWMSPGVILNYLGTAGVHQAQDLRIEEVIPGDLIVNGAITTEKLAAGVLNVGNITGLGALATQNSVNLATQVFNSLPVGSVSGLGSFATVSQITTGNIAALIQSAAIGDAYISSLAASKITAGTLAAGVIYAGTISANQITTGTLNADLITVGTLKANRLELAGITSSLIQPGAITTTVQTSASSIGSISSSWAAIASAAVTHNGKPVRVECSGVASLTVFSNAASAFVSVRLVRDGTPIFSLSGVVQKKGLDPLDDVGTASGNIGFSFADTAPPGTSSTYEFQIALTGIANANATGAMTVTVNRTE